MEPLLIIEGIFQHSENGWRVTPEEGAPIDLGAALQAREGSEVTLQLYFSPPIPPLAEAGGGSCLWPKGLCPHGHVRDPAWMYQQDLSGILTQKDEDWAVGSSLPILGVMPGHRGKLIVFCVKDQATQEADLDSLLGEVGGLLSQFEAMKKAMGEEF